MAQYSAALFAAVCGRVLWAAVYRHYVCEGICLQKLACYPNDGGDESRFVAM